jgi:amino acid transporter
MMKKISILLVIIGVAVIIACLVYFRPMANPVDSDTMTVNPHSIRTSEWPLFIGILTTFVGVCFYFIGVAEEKKAKR